eukprot:s963_g1.t1
MFTDKGGLRAHHDAKSSPHHGDSAGAEKQVSEGVERDVEPRGLRSGCHRRPREGRARREGMGALSKPKRRGPISSSTLLQLLATVHPERFAAPRTAVLRCIALLGLAYQPPGDPCRGSGAHRPKHVGSAGESSQAAQATVTDESCQSTKKWRGLPEAEQDQHRLEAGP